MSLGGANEMSINEIGVVVVVARSCNSVEVRSESNSAVKRIVVVNAAK